MSATKPKCWVDPVTKVPMFRADVSEEEARELEEIVRQAYNLGVLSGYEQGLNFIEQFS